MFVEDTLTSNSFTRNGPERLRRSGVGRIERARIRTLKLTVMIGTFQKQKRTYIVEDFPNYTRLATLPFKAYAWTIFIPFLNSI